MEEALSPLSPSQRESLSARLGVPISKSAHVAIISHCKLEREENTHTSGFIRIYSVKKSSEGEELAYFAEEEEMGTKEIIWRSLESMEEAHKLIQHRTECYALMWGSCCAGQFQYRDVWEQS